MSAALLLGSAPAVSARVIVPAVGVWLATLDLELPASGYPPSGRVVVTLGTQTLVGTVDPASTGRLGDRMRVQVVGGAGAWESNVPALGWHNDAGVTDAAVYATTAAAVGESVVLDVPATRLGVDFVRSAGPASRVFGGASWYVDAAGVTRVGPRPAAALSAEAQVLDFDPNTRRAVIAAPEVVWPGTAFTDARFGALVVRDVEATVDRHGARVVAWCATGSAPPAEGPGQRLARAIGVLARESVGLPFLRAHRYRIVTQGVDGRVTLQSLVRGSTVPDILDLVPVWPGVAGVAQDFVLGTVCLVTFADGDPARPVVVGFDADAEAPVVKVGGGTTAAVLATTAFVNWVNAVSTATSVVAPASYTAAKLKAV